MRRGVRLRGIKVVTKPNGARYVYRRVGGALVPLPDLPENHPDFLAAYVAAGNRAKPQRHSAGTIGAACQAFLASSRFAGMKDSTRASVRRLVDRIAQERGRGLLADLRTDHLRRDMAGMTPAAQLNRLKAWRWVLRHAVDAGLIGADPTAALRPPKTGQAPHVQWSREQIEVFRAHWPQGTAQRTALEVIFWTGARCVDAGRLGWQMVDAGGWLTYIQVKTGQPATCPARHLPEWCAPMAADHAQFLAALPEGRLQWILTAFGAPRSQKGLSQWFATSARAAGLPPGLTAHGLRKSRASALAEAGATAHQIGAWTGHASLSEIAHYTRGANQRAILGGGNVTPMENRAETVSRNGEKP